MTAALHGHVTASRHDSSRPSDTNISGQTLPVCGPQYGSALLIHLMFMQLWAYLHIKKTAICVFFISVMILSKLFFTINARNTPQKQRTSVFCFLFVIIQMCLTLYVFKALTQYYYYFIGAISARTIRWRQNCTVNRVRVSLRDVNIGVTGILL